MAVIDQDPFAIFHTPPPNESPGERAVREAKEAEAKRISNQIDEQLKAERLALRKEKQVVRVLLLGQSESGKSTTLKNFRMKYARAAWNAERASWRSVIQLNVIRSIITIVETLQAEMDGDIVDPVDTPHTSAPQTPASASVSVLSSGSLPRQNAPLSTLLTGKHQLLKLRLGPLRRVETDLKKRLGAGAEEEQDGVAEALGPLSLEVDSQSLVTRQRKEFGVRRLHDALEAGLPKRNLSTNVSRNGHGNEEHTSPQDGVDEATEIISSCLDDMKALWTDKVVRVVLKNRGLRLQDSAGFFLDDLDRIARRDYEPSDGDVVRARLRTLGVQEYRIQPEERSATGLFAGGVGGDTGKTWLLYDVGGSRTVRHAWLPYFENVQAIIFLAPVSCFDERLAEDSRVNRLEDSFVLFRTVCSSQLLAKATMILFLNKMDLLKRKLKSGVLIKKYLPSYGDRANDTETVLKYLREKFKGVLKEHSPEQRTSYYYATSVVDTIATSATIKTVKDSILHGYLKNASVV